MQVLIVKLGATGDVVRTTPLIRKLGGEITWLTEAKNVSLLNGLDNVECFSWEERESISKRRYDLVINLEDTLEVATFLDTFQGSDWFGAYAENDATVRYTEGSSAWFDLSLISIHGRKQADKLKLLNRRTYQELIFGGLGLRFQGEEYLLPEPVDTELSGDVAIAAEAGPVWPMKKWAYYPQLKKQLEDRGLTVNFLPKRASLLEHLSDVRNHRCLISGDSLPMHFALGTGTRCVSLFTCTSPWEIHDYGRQTKLISHRLEEFFYKRVFDENATTTISLKEVADAAMKQFEHPASSEITSVRERRIQ